MLCILGPNGVGKTTLFKAILSFINIMDGEILINQKNISDLSIREKAQTIGYVPQTHNPPFPYKALDVVLMGRTAHLGSSSPGQQDLNIALQCMEPCRSARCDTGFTRTQRWRTAVGIDCACVGAATKFVDNG